MDISIKGNKISSFKGRSIDYNNKVYVYRNLVRKGVVYSIMQNNLVVGHAECLTMSDCYFKINESGLKRARNNGQRNVHGFIVGYIVCDVMGTDAIKLDMYDSNLPVKITYSPFYNDGFVDIDTTKILSSAKAVCLNRNGVSAADVEFKF